MAAHCNVEKRVLPIIEDMAQVLQRFTFNFSEVNTRRARVSG